LSGRDLEEGSFKLHAMDAVVDPAATRLNKLSCRNRRGMPEHSDEVTLAARLDAQDTKAVLLVVNVTPSTSPARTSVTGLGVARWASASA